MHRSVVKVESDSLRHVFFQDEDELHEYVYVPLE